MLPYSRRCQLVWSCPHPTSCIWRHRNHCWWGVGVPVHVILHGGRWSCWGNSLELRLHKKKTKHFITMNGVNLDNWPSKHCVWTYDPDDHWSHIRVTLHTQFGGNTLVVCNTHRSIPLVVLQFRVEGTVDRNLQVVGTETVTVGVGIWEQTSLKKETKS